METRKILCMSAVYPQLVRERILLGLNTWDIVFNVEFQAVLKGGERGEVFSEVQQILEQTILPLWKRDPQLQFCEQVSLRSVPFLMGVWGNGQVIQLASPRLHRELFLLEKSKEGQSKSDIPADFISFVEKFRELDPSQFPTVWQMVTLRHQLPNFLEEKKATAFTQLFEGLAKEVLRGVQDYRPSLFERLTDFGLNLTAKFALIRIHLLKFLAILPSLDHDREGKEVKKSFLEMCRRLDQDSCMAREKGLQGEESALPAIYLNPIRYLGRIVEKLPAQWPAALIRWGVRLMARRFIAGVTIEDSVKALQDLRNSQRSATLDQLGELVVSEREADHYTEKVLELIYGLRMHIPKGELNQAGIPQAHVSIKTSALASDFNPLDEEETFRQVYPRLKRILLAAKDEAVFINVDAEHFSHRELIFYLLRRTLLETPELATFQLVGIVLQAYLRDAYRHFEEILELAKLRGLLMPIRLVKGAYWDAETIEAKVHSYNAPQFLNKEETDLHFRQLIHSILENSSHLQLCLGSHNLADHCYAEALRQVDFPKAPPIEHQCLHMTYEALGLSMVKMGWTVRNYIPIGDLLVGMAYLVRRIMENSSQVGILNIMRSDKGRRDFPAPETVHSQKIGKNQIARDPAQIQFTPEFFNMVPVRLYLSEERKILLETLYTFQRKGQSEDILDLRGKNVFPTDGEIVEVFSPSDPARKVGRLRWANRSDADRAIALSMKTYQEGYWSLASPFVRASVLMKVADLLLAQRMDFTALIMEEAGKIAQEALNDVDEAIDFLNFYAREEVRLEENWPNLHSRGVVAVISPWNFPCAIPCGMVCAALVAGNSVILKSSEQTPLVAQKMVDLFHLAGVPQEVLIHLPGKGEEVGAFLTQDPRVNGYVFTGSKAVGLEVAKRAGCRLSFNPLHQTTTQMKWITEMGGKNAVIITGNAELDETVSGCLQSAFLHAGQKCSALSRILVDNSIKDRFLERFKLAVLDLKVGASDQLSSFMNPLISAQEKGRLHRQVKEIWEETQRLGGKVWVDLSDRPLAGHCLGPVVVELPWTEVISSSKGNYFGKELFGPVIHVVGYPNLEVAIEIFNQTDYALTGGIFSQSQDEVDVLLRVLEAGNLYVNRGCTGARVGIEPFGGFKLSGTGPKAGGKQYLQAFHAIPCSSPLDEENDNAFPAKSQELNPESSAIFEEAPYVSLIHGLKHFQRTYFQDMVSLLEKWSLMKDFPYRGHREENVLREFICWLKVHGEEFITAPHPNRPIPGQWCYNDFTMLKKQGVLVSWQKRPHWTLIMNAMAAISLGLGLTILATEKIQWQFWRNLLDTLKVRADSPHFFSLHYVPGIREVSPPLKDGPSDKHTEFVKLLQDPLVHFVLMDGPVEKVQEVSQWVFGEGTEGQDVKVMKSLLSPWDGQQYKNFEDVLMNFILVRSVSINTMRHGAPLALSQ